MPRLMSWTPSPSDVDHRNSFRRAGTSSIEGSVADPARAPIPNADIKPIRMTARFDF